MKPIHKPNEVNEIAITIEPIRIIKAKNNVNEIHFYNRKHLYESREHDGLKWFEIPLNSPVSKSTY